MSFEVLYRKWRPQTLAEVVGQETVTVTLLNSVRTGRVGHAYLFCGPRGTGKTSTGRILAKAVNCLNPRNGEPCNECEACLSISEGRCLDVIEIDAASNRGVDDIRQLRERVNYAAGTVRRKVYIVDEVHMLTDAASNALLKTLEEPPPHVMFVLATTEFHKVLPTIVSRCQSFHFRRLTPRAIADKLRMVCEREKVEADEEALVAVSRASSGSLRDAENLLQQLIASRGRRLQLDDVRETLGIGDDAYVLKLVSSLLARDLTGGLRVLHDMSDAGSDIRNFGKQVVAVLRDVMLVQAGCEDIVDGGAERIGELRSVAAGSSTAALAAAARRFSEITTPNLAQPLLALELAYIDCVVAGEERPVTRSLGAEEHPGAKPASRASRAPEPSPARARARVEKRATLKRSAPQDTIASGGDSGESGDSADAFSEPAATDGMNTAVEVPESSSAAQEVAGEPVSLVSPPEHVDEELARVRSLWKDYVDSLRGLGSTGNLDAFLRSACEPVALEGDVLVLRFAYEFHKNKVEDPKYRHLVDAQLQEFFGRPLHVSCVLEEATDSPPAASKSTSTPVTTTETLADAALRMGARLRRPR